MNRMAVGGLGPIPVHDRVQFADLGSSLLDVAVNLPEIQASDFTILCDLDGTLFDLPQSPRDILLLLARLQLCPWCNEQEAAEATQDVEVNDLPPEDFAIKVMLTIRNQLGVQDLPGHATRGLEPLIGDNKAASLDLVDECAKVVTSCFNGDLDDKPRDLLVILGRKRSALSRAILDAAFRGRLMPVPTAVQDRLS